MVVNIRDIASNLNVSAATVSRSLRQDPMIHPKTRARVIETAMKMGYQGRARRIDKQNRHQKTLGVIIPGYYENPGHLNINLTRDLQGITAAADGSGVLLQLKGFSLMEENMTGKSPSSWSDLNLDMCQAVIVTGCSSPAFIASILEHIPLISISWVFPGLSHDAVTPDDVGGVRGLVEEMVQQGHRKMAWVGEWYPAPFFEARQAGFIQGCLAGNLNLGEQEFLGGDLFENKFELRPSRILQACVRGVSGFVCANDRVALEVIGILEANGIRVPEQVSVTGFDAVGQPGVNGKELTTVDPRFIEVGRAALKLALQRLEDPSAPQTKWVISSSIIPGQTLGPKSGAP
jgi:LacI family transcriptional regulator